MLLKSMNTIRVDGSIGKVVITCMTLVNCMDVFHLNISHVADLRRLNQRIPHQQVLSQPCRALDSSAGVDTWRRRPQVSSMASICHHSQSGSSLKYGNHGNSQN